jgi:dihydroorotase
MNGYLLYNALVTTGEISCKGAVSITKDIIDGVWLADENDCIVYNGVVVQFSFFPTVFEKLHNDFEIIDLGGMVLMAGGIDMHVHFREPGMTQKADIESESKAALLGGITSFADMPNNYPATVTPELLFDKLERAKGRSWANYSFHFGATNDNLQTLRKLESGDPWDFAGVKIFMGSSVGNMLVDDSSTLAELFQVKKKVILIHSEDQSIINANLEKEKEIYGDDIPVKEHEMIRSREACISSTSKALDLAKKYQTPLHILHVSTAEEVDMIREAKRENPFITAEASPNYLWFSDEDYERLGSLIKCNPSIKRPSDREAIIAGLKEGVLDTIGTDHAPHLLCEKNNPYLESPGGIPSVQHSLSMVITIAKASGIPLTTIARAMSEKVSDMFGIKNRGHLDYGNYADITVVDPDERFTVTKDCLAYKCGWSPLEGAQLYGAVKMVFLNGELVVENGKLVCDKPSGRQLYFIK